MRICSLGDEPGARPRFSRKMSLKGRFRMLEIDHQRDRRRKTEPGADRAFLEASEEVHFQARDRGELCSFTRGPVPRDYRVLAVPRRAGDQARLVERPETRRLPYDDYGLITTASTLCYQSGGRSGSGLDQKSVGVGGWRCLAVEKLRQVAPPSALAKRTTHQVVLGSPSRMGNEARRSDGASNEIHVQG